MLQVWDQKERRKEGTKAHESAIKHTEKNKSPSPIQ